MSACLPVGRAKRSPTSLGCWALRKRLLFCPPLNHQRASANVVVADGIGAGDSSGGLSGSPKYVRIALMALGSKIAATSAKTTSPPGGYRRHEISIHDLLRAIL